jgi:hypothetical protein
MKHILAGLALALVFLTVAPKAHAQDETSGQQLLFKANIGTGAGCGAFPVACTGPINIGGTFWFDFQPTIGSTGVLYLNGVADMGTSLVTVTTVAAPAITGLPSTYSKITIAFKGITNDGDNAPYTGTAILTFSWYYTRSGGGRGGGGGGWKALLTSATFAVTYN